MPFTKPNSAIRSPSNLGASAIQLSAGQLLTRAVNFLWMVYFSKKIGPSNFGLYTIVMSFVALALPVANFGISLTVIRDAARWPSKSPNLFGDLFWIRLLSSCVFWGVLMIVLPLFGYQKFLTKTFLLAGLYLAV